MELVIIKGNRCLLGEDVELNGKDCFSLKVGDVVRRIGKWKSSSSYEANFNPPAVYSGQIELDHKYAAFRLPDSGVTGWNLFKPKQPVYMLFAIDEEFGRLFLIDDKRLNAYPHWPVFDIINENKE